ncbi:MAG: FimD/PapC C-terminal domain-containing protein, partial [Betaproteobacteria bacterium]
PAGATVNMMGQSEVFYTARRGEAFVTGLQASNQLELRWQDQRCQIQVDLPEQSIDEVLRMGPLSCKGLKR